MRFGAVHRLLTDALAALGLLALVTGGQFNRTVSITMVVGLVAALASRDWLQKNVRFEHLDTVAVLGVLAIQATRAALGESVLDVIVEFAAALQIVRLATRRGAAHDQQVIILSLLHLVAGTVLGGGIGYGFCFFGVLVVAPGALVLSHLRREVEGNYRQGARDRTGLPVDVPRILRSRRVVGRTFVAMTCLLSLPIFVFTATLFVLFPRVGLSLLLLNRSHPTRMVGFSSRVDLSEVGVLRSDPTIALRIEVPGLGDSPPPRLSMHLRGTGLDAYDGRTWSQSIKRSSDRREGDTISFGKAPPADALGSTTYHVELEPIDPPVVFVPDAATSLRLVPRGPTVIGSNVIAVGGPEGEYRYQPADERGLKYDVTVARAGTPTFREPLAPSDRPRYLSVPSSLPDRVRALAARWAEGSASTTDKARAIERRLHSEYRYDLDSPSTRAFEPLDHFLFESKRGHCEFYSTAMAILLRSLGVPTRNVTGFVGGTYNRFGRFYAVRQGDAHSWVEVYSDEQGAWITFDPTPPADAAPRTDVGGVFASLRDFLEATSQRWDHHVVNYDLNQQASLWQTLTSRYRNKTTSQGGEKSRRFPRVAIVIGALTVALIALGWARRRKALRSPGEARTRGSTAHGARVATALYVELGAALETKGVGRPEGVPPLQHAEKLAERTHPLASEVLDLTRVYLSARFGGEALSDVTQRDFQRRIRAIRAWKPVTPSAREGRL